MKYPIRTSAVLCGLLVLAALPAVAQEQADGRVSDVALTMPGLRQDGDGDGAVDARTAKVKPAATTEEEKKQKPARHSATAKTARPEKRKIEVSKAVPRSTFEDRTARYFDPLSLTIAPEARIDPADTPYNPVDGTFQAADRGQVAVVPDSPISNQITSAGIENMGRGNNHTVVVPLFQLLNKLSDGPAPPP